MKIIQRFCKAFGIINVKEYGNQVKVTGVDGLVLKRHFKILFETDALAKTMFTTMTDTSFSFNKFFVPDFIFMFAKLREDPSTTWSGRRTIDKIVKGFLENTWFKCSVGDVKPIIDMSRINVMKWKPMPKQIEFLDLFGERMVRYDLRGYILGFAPGGGKAQPLDANIRTSEGWTKMGDITLDHKAVMPDGSLKAITGIYPQGEKDIYRITFEDGRTAECCDEHLWKVRHKDWARVKDGADGWRVLPFADIRLHIALHPNENRLYVPLPEPQVTEDVELPVDPYVLGILLGDGYMGNGSARISTADRYIVDEVTRLLPEGFELAHRDRVDYAIVKSTRNDGLHKSTFIDDIRLLNLDGTRSHIKFIPYQYVKASPSQKLSLIQGLMDSDGTVSENGSLSFCTVSEVLANQFQELVRSLGGLAKIRLKETSYTYKGERRQGKLAYHVNIRIKDPKSFFRLPRKKDLTPENYQYADRLKLRIKTIDYVGKKQAQCISVDHPDRLYITNDYIVTHNTFADLLVAECLIPPEVAEVKIIISPKKALHLVWEKTIKSVFKKVPTYWCCDSGIRMPYTKCEYYIFNFEQIDRAIELGEQLLKQGTRYFVLVDESHNFADWRSSRTQKLVKLQTLHKDILFLWTSGTPVLKSAAELTSFLKCSDHRFDDDAERRFRRIYSAAPGRANDIFNHRLGRMMAFVVGKSAFSTSKPTIKELPVKLPPALAHKFLMSTVREDMKKFIEQRLEVYKGTIKDLRKVVEHWLDYHERSLKTRADRKAFDDYQKQLKMIMKAPDLMMPDVLSKARTYERTKLLPSIPPMERKKFRSALSAVKNIKLKVRGEALGTVLSKRRSECAAMLGVYCKPEQIMKESLSKTMFFASSVPPVKMLEEYLTKQGYEPVLVWAGTNSELTKNIDRFTDDPNVNPVCATMQSLSEAVPVTAASTVVLLNRPFRQATWDQVTARADRLGQVHPVTIIEVTLDTGGEPNVSSTTDAILANVRELINDIIGPDFAGPPLDERVYQTTIDASKENIVVEFDDAKLGL